MPDKTRDVLKGLVDSMRRVAAAPNQPAEPQPTPPPRAEAPAQSTPAPQPAPRPQDKRAEVPKSVARQ
jgi:DamX protein